MKLVHWQRPSLTNWPTLGRLSDLHDEIDRLFESPFTELMQNSNLLGAWTPALDVYENKDNFVVKAELAGMRKEDIEVSIHEGNLSISGERKTEKKQENGEAFRTERFYGRFQRSISLPAAVAVEKVKADYKDGVLTVTLPKTEEAKPRHIDVSVN